jgi:acyl-CoA synthetase (AMP-forming)/AMP-acid ligase II
MTLDWPAKLFTNRSIDSEIAFDGAGAQTVGALVGLATRLSEELDGIDAGRATVVACRDRFFFASALLGSWMAEHPVALPPNTQPATLRSVRDAEPGSIILHDTDTPGGVDLRRLDFEPLDPRQGPVLNREVHLATVLTSGSTATPVAHRKTAGQLLGEARMLVEHFELTGRRVVSCVPSHHLYGLLFGVLSPMVGGGSFSRQSPLQPRAVVECLRNARATVLISAPPQLAAMSKTARLEFPTMHAIFSSGAPLGEAVATTLANRWHAVTEVFGATETGGIGYRSVPAKAWTPLPGVTVAQGEGDRLLLTRGFFGRDHDGAYLCQDRGHVLRDGSFDFLGRSDGVVKVGARRTHIGHVTSIIRELDGVDDAAVVSRPSRSGRGTELWALVRSDTLDAGSVRSGLALHLDPAVIPRRIRVISTPLPRNEMGKTSAAMVIATMEEQLSEIQLEEAGPNEVAATISPDLVFFKGHFPGNPILPAVIQLDRLVLPQVRLRWPDLGSVRVIRRIKFKSPVRPGQRLRIHVERDGDRVRFRICSEAEPDLVFSEGTLILEQVEG